MSPVDIYVESRDVRAVRGGTGYTKCGGNYAASLRAGEAAAKKGYVQVLWLDGVERKYVEEVGAPPLPSRSPYPRATTTSLHRR